MPVPDELDGFAEFSSDKFRNLDEVDEYHDRTAEFPMDIETDSAVLAGAAMGAAELDAAENLKGTEESKEEEKREKEISDKNTKEIIKNATNISTAQALAPVAAALVVTSAIILPIIDNIDVEVNLNVEFVAGILSYSIEIINASEDENYEAFVYEGSSIIKETVIKDGHLEDSIGGLPPYKEHRVEVRSGTPALYVMGTNTIPAAPSWAEWSHLTVGFDVIDYGVYYYGVSGEATITLEDPYDETILYTKSLEEGFNSDIITGLRSSHLYTLTVASDSTLYLCEEIETEYTDVEWDHLYIIDNTIDYGVISDYSIYDLTITLSDPETATVIYTKDLLQGYDGDTIIDLEFGHTYMLTVATEDEIYLEETVVTDSEPVTVTVGHITPVNNTIDYEISVSGEGKTLTLSLYDVAGGPPVFTSTLKSGTNSKIIEGLQYSHNYLLIVTSSTKNYVSEYVTTETEPTKVTLGHLKATQTTIDYEVTVTGTRDVATAYLKDTATGKVLYSKDLKVGVNSAIIDKLEVNHTYQFTVSSKTETFINQSITTDPTQTEVVLNHIRPVNETIDYEVTVTGNSDAVTAYLYDSDGKELFSALLSIGSNTGVIRDLEYGSTYNFVVSSETKKYAEAAVTIDSNPMEVILNDISPKNNTISYDVTVTGTSDVVYAYLYDEGGTELYSAELSEGANQAVIEGLEYDHGYQFSLASETRIFITETVSTEVGDTKVTVNYIETSGDTVKYSVYVEGKADSIYLIVRGTEYDPEPGKEYVREQLSAGDNTGVIDEDLEYGESYEVVIMDGNDKLYYLKVIVTDVQFNVYAESKGIIINYEVTLYDVDLSKTIIALYDAETQVSEPVPIAQKVPPAEGTSTDSFEGDYMQFYHIYKVSILYDGEEVDYIYVTTEDHVMLRAFSPVDSPYVHYEVSVYDVDYSDMSVAIYDDVNLTHCMEKVPITASETSDDFELPGMNYNRTYWVTVENSEELIKSQALSTTNVGSIVMDAIDNAISCDISIFIDDISDLTIRLYYDEECEEPASGEIAVTGKNMVYVFKDLEYNFTYYCGILWKGDVATTFDEAVEFGEVDGVGIGNTIKCDVSVNTDSFSGVMLCLYHDMSFEDIAAGPVQVSGRTMEYTFTLLDYDETYYVAVTKDDVVMASKEWGIGTEPFSASIEASATGNAINSTITFDIVDFSGVTVGLYTTDTCSTFVQGYGPEDVDGSPKQYNCSGLQYSTNYYIGIKYNGDKMVSSKVTTEPFSASIDAAVIGNTIQSTITFDIVDFSGVKVGLYSDPNCDNSIPGYSPVIVSGSPKSYNCSGLQYNTDYYIGIKYDGVKMASEKVTTDGQVEANQFGIDEMELCLFYDISIYSDYEIGTISVKDITEATATPVVISTREINYDEDGYQITSEGDEVGLYDWEVGHTYSLKIELDGVSYDLKTLEIPNPVQSLTYYTSGNKIIHYEATLGTLTFPISLYLCAEEGDYAEKTIDIANYPSGNIDCTYLDDGAYYLLVNMANCEYPPEGACWSSGEIYLSTDVSVDASQSGNGTIIAEVSFDPSAGSNVTIGVYTGAGPGSPVYEPISIPYDTTTEQYEFSGLTSGMYFITIIRDGDDVLASDTVTLV